MTPVLAWWWEVAILTISASFAATATMSNSFFRIVSIKVMNFMAVMHGHSRSDVINRNTVTKYISPCPNALTRQSPNAFGRNTVSLKIVTVVFVLVQS